MKKIEERNLSYYLSLPYTILLKKDSDGDFVARIDELAGCISHGRDEAEALTNLSVMKEMWIEDCLASGQEVPVPESDDELPSGKWVQRTTRQLHGKLVRTARREGVSLNQLVTSILAEGVGRRESMSALEAVVARKLATMFAKTHAITKHPWDYSRIFGEPWSVTVDPFVPGAALNAETLMLTTKIYHADETKEKHPWRS